MAKAARLPKLRWRKAAGRGWKAGGYTIHYSGVGNHDGYDLWVVFGVVGRCERHIDTFGVLASAAAELKCAADVIYATHSIPEAMLDATLARLAEAMATVRAIKEGTT